MAHHPQHTQDSESSTAVSRVLTGLAIGGAVLGAGIILAPHLLPALGVGTASVAEQSAFMLHTSSGLAGAVNSALAAVPLIGGKLAAGGLFNAAVTGVVGIGGVLLGNFVANREDGSKRIKWGNVIKFAALAASALIALPTVLTALSCGLVYLSSLAGNVGATSRVMNAAGATLGSMGGHGSAMMGISGMAAAIPHMFSCGIPLLPIALSMTVLKNKPKPAQDSVALQIFPDAPLEAGKPCHAKLKLIHKQTGKALTSDQLARTHTEKLHLLLVDQSLKDYQHIHPQPTAEPGVFSANFTPQLGTKYNAWADFNTQDGTNHQISTTLPAAQKRNIPPQVSVNTQAQSGDLQATWESNEPLQQGKETLVHVTLRDSAGSLVNDLQPVMGAYAHLVGFCADGTSLIHSHPIGAEPTAPDDRGGPRLSFHLAPESCGPTQFYMQVRRNDRDVMIPFGQRIQPAEKSTDKEQARRSENFHGAGQTI